MSITMKLEVDDRDISPCPVAASSLHLVPQTNGVIRVHAYNGGYLFSLVRSSLDGSVQVFQNGFGTIQEPVVIYAHGKIRQ